MSDLGKYDLPAGWRWTTIPDLVGDDGVFIDGDWVESKDQDPAGDVRLIQLADVGDGIHRDKSDRFMTKAKANELRCTFLEKGDVLIARMPDPLGRACIFPGDDKPSVTVVDVAIARSGNGEFDHRWLASFVNAHPSFRLRLASNFTRWATMDKSARQDGDYIEQLTLLLFLEMADEQSRAPFPPAPSLRSAGNPRADPEGLRLGPQLTHPRW